MPTALVVDDSQVDLRLASALLQRRSDLTVRTASNGEKALAEIQRSPPDLVVTDLQMPDLNGLELVREIRKHHPTVTVILMTAVGSEEIAAQALREGAAGYVPKRYLSRDLAQLVEHTLALAGHQREQQSALECLTRSEVSFLLDNDSARIQPLLQYLRQEMSHIVRCDETELMRVRVALDEAISNAMEHGNLEADSQLKESGEDYAALIRERRNTPPHSDRRVYVNARFTHASARFVVRDEGPGFDQSMIPDPTDPSNLDKLSGRGLLLIRTFMDEVSFNEKGNEVTMVKYASTQIPSATITA